MRWSSRRWVGLRPRCAVPLSKGKAMSRVPDRRGSWVLVAGALLLLVETARPQDVVGISVPAGSTKAPRTARATGFDSSMSRRRRPRSNRCTRQSPAAGHSARQPGQIARPHAWASSHPCDRAADPESGRKNRQGKIKSRMSPFFPVTHWRREHQGLFAPG